MCPVDRQMSREPVVVGGERQVVLGHGREAGSGCIGQPRVPLSLLVQISNYLSCSCSLGLSWENCSKAATEQAEPPG